MKRRSSDDKVVAQHKTRSRKERLVNDDKYIGMDVHKATTVISVLNPPGKEIAKGIIETKGATILDYLKGIRGTLHVGFEEGNQAAWLYDLIRRHVAEVVVCNRKKNDVRNHKTDEGDAKDLAESLRTGALQPVYHGTRSTEPLKEFAKSYAAIVRDSTRVKSRIKALFQGRGIICTGDGIYDADQHESWIDRLDNVARRTRASRLFRELDVLDELREEAEKDLIAETKKHPAAKILQSIPGIGLVRAAVIIAFVATPFRFRTRRQFWTYCGLAVRSRITGEYIMVEGQVRRSMKLPLVRGLNRDFNHAMKEVFKGAAKSAANGPWKPQFDALIANGTEPRLAMLTLARKLASTTLTLWKKGEQYDEEKVKIAHAA
jgi:transposase